MDRRLFVKRVGQGALALGIGEVSMGISCATVFTDILNYVPVALTSFDEILTLISPLEAAALAPIIADVKVALADIQAAVVNYENAPAASKATLACKIQTVIQIAEQTLNQFWSDLNLPDAGLAATIEGVLQIILSTLVAFIPSLNCTAPSSVTLKALKRRITYQPKMRSVKQFKKDINAALVQGHQNPIFK